MGIYPFVDGKLEDFEPIFARLIEQGLKEPYDPDQFASAFLPVAKALESRAAGAEAAGQTEQACALWLRAAAVYRIARFPIVCSPKTEEAWVNGKATYLRASPYMSPMNREVSIPHKYGIQGERGQDIKAYLRMPAEKRSPNRAAPVLLFICGLDAYRTDHTSRTEQHNQHGFACLSIEIPGTGDSPALRSDPESPDRQWSSVLDWIATQPELDAKQVFVRGVSTGGYYAMRIAHTHAHRLRAVVAQGGGSHDMFHPDWIAAQDNMEYPFGLAETIALKFGYTDLEAFKREAQSRYSLLNSGIIDKPSCRLLLVNGVNDEIFPIEDSKLLCEHGSVKDIRLVLGRSHMGNPETESVLYDWLDQFI